MISLGATGTGGGDVAGQSGASSRDHYCPAKVQTRVPEQSSAAQEEEGTSPIPTVSRERKEREKGSRLKPKTCPIRRRRGRALMVN